MGGYEEPITHLLRAARWRVVTLPFFYFVVCPARFLRNIKTLRRSRLRSLLLDVLAVS